MMTNNTNTTDNHKALHKFIKSLPKIELHAHLNGCIREHTLVQLATERNVTLPPKVITHHHEAQQQQQQQHEGEEDFDTQALFLNTRPRNLSDCFEVFEYIPQCVTDLTALRRIVNEVLMDVMEDGVVYIELRTGPKCLLRRRCYRHSNNSDIGGEGDEEMMMTMATKKEYVETIIEIMQEFEMRERRRYEEDITKCRQLLQFENGTTYNSTSSSTQDDSRMTMLEQIVRLPLIPRLIISVDRAGTVEQADENINLAIELFQQKQSSNQKYIVGVELGGNPTRNDFAIFEATFERARKAGLRVSIHIGEVPMQSNDVRYNEALKVINFRPDRLGHALTLSPSLMDLLEKNPIPIECCPTSNTMTLDFALHHEGSLIDGIKMHPHLTKWIDLKYPISINTDDSGVFCTNLTKEMMLVAKAFDLDEKKLSEIVLSSVDHVFDDDVKTRLQNDIQSVTEMMMMMLMEKKEKR
jgi:adenosine deaminase